MQWPPQVVTLNQIHSAAPTTPTSDVESAQLGSHLCYFFRMLISVILEIGNSHPRLKLITLLPALRAAKEWEEQSYSKAQPEKPHQQEGYRAWAFRLYVHRLHSVVFLAPLHTSPRKACTSLPLSVLKVKWIAGQMVSGTIAMSSDAAIIKSILPRRKIVPRPEGWE
jgi:hypothetical protein